ncbi:unnamed protein product [Chondrus crispus]|uniref:Uncharacterized protein n=1 Tax=Chondrus crispus TaxID=2769 RepID=R7Q679_CHOCR|nr:unnamed protein product [Chondrus crispus]CDF33499.1 unnamed protein product [Chondrus crispus]|eukprot:XP_005713302.1 unnamed protein product [Chondrus crispus]
MQLRPPASPAANDSHRKLGWGDVVGSIVAAATSTEVMHHAMQDLFPRNKYFRFHPTTDSTQIDETHPDALASFAGEAQAYIREKRQDLDLVAAILRPKTPQGLWMRFRDALGN